MTFNLSLPQELPLTTRRTVQRALALLEHHLREPASFTSTTVVRDWLCLKMTGLEREMFLVLYLNQQNQLITHETLFTGTINSTEVHPREVVKSALRHNAAAVLFAHNHPSGEAEPSQSRQTDYRQTGKGAVAGRNPGAGSLYSRRHDSGFICRTWLVMKESKDATD